MILTQDESKSLQLAAQSVSGSHRESEDPQLEFPGPWPSENVTPKHSDRGTRGPYLPFAKEILAHVPYAAYNRALTRMAHYAPGFSDNECVEIYEDHDVVLGYPVKDRAFSESASRMSLSSSFPL